MGKSEVENIRTLLMEDVNWKSFCLEPVSDRAEEMCCGWKMTRPSAAYDLTKTGSKRKKAVPTLPVADTLTDNDINYTYMSGELDENYKYVYKGGLSNRADQKSGIASAAERSIQTQPQRHVQTVTLEPSQLNDASAHVQALASCRAELSRILSLQVKPELLVEQLIIENRLRAMSLSAFPVLGGIDSQCRRNERTYSHSTPALWTLSNTHVNYLSPRHKTREKNPRCKPPDGHETKKPNMQWSESLSPQRNSSHRKKLHAHVVLPQLSYCQSPLHVRERSARGGVKQTTSSRLTRVLSSGPAGGSLTSAPPASRYLLPVVAPSLSSHATAGARQSKANRHLNALLYKSTKENDSTRCQKSNSFTAESTFYYPQVSYSNSKLK